MDISNCNPWLYIPFLLFSHTSWSQVWIPAYFSFSSNFLRSFVTFPTHDYFDFLNSQFKTAKKLLLVNLFRGKRIKMNIIFQLFSRISQGRVLWREMPLPSIFFPTQFLYYSQLLSLISKVIIYFKPYIENLMDCVWRI